MPHSILIIGEDASEVDFSAPGMTAYVITRGLNGARDRLRSKGHKCDILWTRGEDSIEAMASEALAMTAPDVIVIGAGLRLLPLYFHHFERLRNTLHAQAPRARSAFNSKPDNSDLAALRQLGHEGWAGGTL